MSKIISVSRTKNGVKKKGFIMKLVCDNCGKRGAASADTIWGIEKRMREYGWNPAIIEGKLYCRICGPWGENHPTIDVQLVENFNRLLYFCVDHSSLLLRYKIVTKIKPTRIICTAWACWDVWTHAQPLSFSGLSKSTSKTV